MKIWHIRKRTCQNEPMDLSLPNARPSDGSFETDYMDNIHETLKETVEDSVPQDGALGDNTDDPPREVNNSVETEPEETPKSDKYTEGLEAICKTWSEVKLLQMKSSDNQFY